MNTVLIVENLTKMPIVNKCDKCGIDRRGRGMYYFDYLTERVFLCGRCASKVMKFIKGEKR